MASKRGKKLLKSDSTRESIKSYLEELAPIERIWAYFDLVHFMSDSGQVMVVADDDDDRVEACIAYLESMGLPIFTENTEMDAHADILRERLRSDCK